ncbi:MAG: hypothetical protein K2X29_02370 [Candidatus Obscuribacterales bacterium]|nr:hypothetical protein [Candidatus Obscuribacterales bacterium]
MPEKENWSDFSREPRMALSSFGEKVANEVDMLGRTLQILPNSVGSEILHRWQANMPQSIGDVAYGLMTGYAFSRAPRLLALSGLAFVVPAVGKGLTAIFNDMKRTWNSDATGERELAARDFAQTCAGGIAMSLELGPTILAGHRIGTLSSSHLQNYSRYAEPPAKSIFNNVLARQFANVPFEGKVFEQNVFNCWRPSKSFFAGKESELLPPGLKGESGKIDLLGISKWLSERHPWDGLEVTTKIRLSDMRMSRPFSGAPDRCAGGLGKPKGEPFIDFHTHPPGGEYNYSNSSPSLPDLKICGPLAVIQSGTRTTIFEGDKRGHKPVYYKGANLGSIRGYPATRAVVFDRERRLATEYDTEYRNKYDQEGWFRGNRALNYDHFEKTLSNWDGNWSSVRSIPTESNPSENWIRHTFM